jgi:hypothetical protein
MMAHGKAESIPRDRPESATLHEMIRKLQQDLLYALPLLIDRLNPGTFGEWRSAIHLRTRADDQLQARKAMSPFRGVETDDLLADIRSSSKRVRVYAQEIMDKIIVSSSEMSKHIQEITKQTEQEVGELRVKVDELLNHQKSFQIALDAASGKNNLFSFLMEYLSKLIPAVVL